MTSTELVERVTRAHGGWTKLPPREREQSLKLHLARHHPDLFRALQVQPGVMRALPPEVLADWTGYRRRGVRYRTLQVLMPAIASRWLHACAAGDDIPFEAYCTSLLREYRTAEALRAYLGVAGPTGGAKR